MLAGKIQKRILIEVCLFETRLTSVVRSTSGNEARSSGVSSLAYRIRNYFSVSFYWDFFFSIQKMLSDGLVPKNQLCFQGIPVFKTMSRFSNTLNIL